VSVERLHFEPGRVCYEWRLVTEHVVRYAFAAALCRGRRVLDVACGEGYGSYMLAQAGATAVVGLDVDAAAIATAESRFAAPGVRYLVGDATNLAGVLATEPPFDVVVSFETIEHVAVVELFLDGIRAVLAPDGIAIVSAPNEPGPPNHDSANPFHRRTFTFEQFRTLTQRHLGPARRWYFGTPLQGMVLAEAGSSLLLNDRSDLSLMLEGRRCDESLLLPAQRNLRVGEADCAFFVGVWGAEGGVSIAGSPAATAGILEPWAAVEWFRAENARLLRERETPASTTRQGADIRSRMLADSVADLRRAALLDKARLETAEAALGKAQDAAEAARRTEVARALQVARTEAELRAEVARLAVEARTIGARLKVIETSRGWRLVQAYARLLTRPVAGWPLRRLRRMFGGT